MAFRSIFRSIPRPNLRFAGAEQLEYLMPVFWIGFNIAMFPGAALAKRFGMLPVIAVAAVLGAAGAGVGMEAQNIEGWEGTMRGEGSAPRSEMKWRATRAKQG